MEKSSESGEGFPEEVKGIEQSVTSEGADKVRMDWTILRYRAKNDVGSARADIGSPLSSAGHDAEYYSAIYAVLEEDIKKLQEFRQVAEEAKLSDIVSEVDDMAEFLAGQIKQIREFEKGRYNR